MCGRLAAITWIINNQLGRRNLHPDQASYLRGKRYNGEKQDRGGERGNQYTVAKDQNDNLPKTNERLAAEYNVSPATITRDGQYAASVDALAKAGSVEVPAGTIPGWEKEFLEKLADDNSRNWSDFTPPLYNIWKQQSKSNKVDHFGNSHNQSRIFRPSKQPMVVEKLAEAGLAMTRGDFFPSEGPWLQSCAEGNRDGGVPLDTGALLRFGFNKKIC